MWRPPAAAERDGGVGALVCSVYTRPELAFRLGDRVEVTDEGGSVWMGRASDSFRYDSHCVTVVEISGVEPSAGDAEGVCGGQVSRETEKEGQV